MVTPSLVYTGRRLKPEWLEAFLTAPSTVRPSLGAMMPKLPISEVEAKIIASTLLKGAEPEVKIISGDPARGRLLLTEKKCIECHDHSETGPVIPWQSKSTVQRLAPDLSVTKYRMSPAMIVAWLTNPQAVAPFTLMPKPELNSEEIQDLVATIMTLPEEPRPEIDNLPLKPLDRAVSFAEVRERITDRTCRHCHANEQATGGAAGAGNTGGFGYPGKGLDLSSEQGLKRGVLDPKSGQRRSIITAAKGEYPLLIKVLLTRHREMVGDYDKERIGMPLGLAPVPFDDIQLLYTWCLQQ